jgi:hypothetical protein
VGVLSLSMLNFVSWCLSPTTWADNSAHRGLIPPLYLAQSDANALAFLNARPTSEKENQAVLCSPKIGSYVPRATAMSVFTGHWAETLNLSRKLGEAEAFYSGRMSEAEARAWLEKNHIGWIFEHGSSIASRYPFLKSAWSQNESRVLRFQK